LGERTRPVPAELALAFTRKRERDPLDGRHPLHRQIARGERISRPLD
jgi:hypothetical protein